MPSSLWHSYKDFGKALELLDLYKELQGVSVSQAVKQTVQTVGYPVVTYGIVPLVGWALMLIFCIPALCVATRCLPYQKYSRRERRTRKIANKILKEQAKTVENGTDPLDDAGVQKVEEFVKASAELEKVRKSAYVLEQAGFWALVAWFAMTMVFVVAWIMAMAATGSLVHAADLNKMEKTADLAESAISGVINGADTVVTNIVGEQCSVFEDLAKGIDKSFVQSTFEKQLREFPLM